MLSPNEVISVLTDEIAEMILNMSDEEFAQYCLKESINIEAKTKRYDEIVNQACLEAQQRINNKEKSDDEVNHDQKYH